MTPDEMIREMRDKIKNALDDFEKRTGLEVVLLELTEEDVSNIDSSCLEVARQIRIHVKSKRGWYDRR